MTVTPARGTSTNPPETEEWWSSFQDAELNSLITRAVDRNLDLKLALEHVQEARAARASHGQVTFRPSKRPPRRLAIAKE
jgi:outer membrane protein TolC